MLCLNYKTKIEFFLLNFLKDRIKENFNIHNSMDLN